jgi:hypothetical protein
MCSLQLLKLSAASHELESKLSVSAACTLYISVASGGAY